MDMHKLPQSIMTGAHGHAQKGDANHCPIAQRTITTYDVLKHYFFKVFIEILLKTRNWHKLGYENKSVKHISIPKRPLVWIW